MTCEDNSEGHAWLEGQLPMTTNQRSRLALEANDALYEGGNPAPISVVVFRVRGLPNGEEGHVIRDPDAGGWRISRDGQPWGTGYAEPLDALRALQAALDHALREGACPECLQAGRHGGDLEWVWTGIEPWVQGLGVALGGAIPEGRSGYLWRCRNPYCAYSEGFTPA